VPGNGGEGSAGVKGEEEAEAFVVLPGLWAAFGFVAAAEVEGQVLR
jgi:hypothetical protein